MRASRRAAILIAVGLIIAVAVVSVLLLRYRDNADDSPAVMVEGSTQPPAGVAAFDDSRARQVSDDLASHDEDRLRSAVAIPTGQPLSPNFGAQLAAIAPIEFDLASVRYLDDSVATVTAHGGGSASNSWTVFLVLDQSEWKISTTAGGEDK